MPIVEAVKKDGAPVTGLFQKIATEGDIERFAAAESGKVQVVGLADTSGRVVAGTGYFDVTLDFNYLVGVNQLLVGLVDPSTGRTEGIISRTAILTALAASGANFPPSFNTATLKHFDEVSANVVRVYNVSSADIVVFEVPHTATPAEIIRRLLVQRQGDSVAVELLGEGDGLLFKAPNGRRGLLRLTNNLTMAVQPR